MRAKSFKLNIALGLCVLFAASCAHSEALLLRGADLYPVSQAVIKKGELLIEDGKIKAIGNNLSISENTKIIEVSGKRIYPGFIHSNTLAGLTEISSVRAMNDYAEVGLINANARAQSAIDPDSELLPVIRAQGVTALHVMPQGGPGLFTGTSSLVQPNGWSIDEMAIKPEVGVVLAWPTPRVPDFIPEEMAAEIKKQIDTNRSTLLQTVLDAKAYWLDRAGPKSLPVDLRYEALQPVFARERKLFVLADDLIQIREAVQFCAQEKLRCVLVGLQDGWRLASLLSGAQREQGMEFILGSPFTLPARRSEDFDTGYANASKLRKAGIEFAISGDGSSFSAPMDGGLAFNAAQYAAFGLDPAYALAAISLKPAEILGVADQIGSLEVGKQANFIISSGDALEISSKVEQVYIQGKALDMSSRHTRLRDKYQQKIDQSGAK